MRGAHEGRAAAKKVAVAAELSRLWEMLSSYRKVVR